MFESRCGVLCNDCQRRDQVNCSGCTQMERPFWGGECGVKTCCEGKGLDHCGLCEQFPCQMLASMGVEQGHDPAPRLAILRHWAAQEDATEKAHV